MSSLPVSRSQFLERAIQIRNRLAQIGFVRSIYHSAKAAKRFAKRCVSWAIVSAAMWPLHICTGLRLCVLPGMDRIGQQACFIDAYLRRWAAGIRERDIVVFVYGDGANGELDKLLARYVRMITSPVLADIIASAAPWLPNRLLLPNLFGIYGALEYATMPTVLGVNAQERMRGQGELERLGVGPNDWFATFHARDTAYIDLSYHDYRNGSIKNCMLAAEHIVSCGGWAIRLGATVEERLVANRHPRIIDYALEHRSEFLDIYLTAENRLHIGNSSGISSVPIAFGKPCGMANMVPLGCYGIGRDTFWMPKLLREAKTGRVLTFNEAYERELFTLEGPMFLDATYPALGLEFVENTPEDILGLTKDLLDHIEGRSAGAEAKRLQEMYSDRFLSQLPEYRNAARLAPSFALRYRDLIEA